MYEELLAKIQGYLNDLIEFDKTQKTRNRHDIGFLEGIVHVSKEILGLIEEYKLQELHRPDLPGAYLRFTDKWIATEVYKDVNNNLYIIELNGLKWQSLYKLEGRWIKIDLPEEVI